VLPAQPKALAAVAQVELDLVAQVDRFAGPQLGDGPPAITGAQQRATGERS
jgi:hypothetical protein